MKKLLLPALAVLALSLSAVTSANNITSNDLYLFCTSKDPTIQIGCPAYILGFVHGVADGNIVKIIPNKPRISMVTFINMFKKFIDDQPEFGDTEADTVLSALLLRSGHAEEINKK